MPDGRALVTERPGRIRLLERDGRCATHRSPRSTSASRARAACSGSRSTPTSARTASCTSTSRRPTEMQLERWRFEGDALRREADLIDGTIQAGTIHDSGRIAFGPDGDLYVATGEAGQPELAQDPQSLNGKYLRLDARAVPRRGEPAGDRLARAPQPAGLRLGAGHRPPDLDRARPERRRRPAGLRRDQRDPRGRELRLAGGVRLRPRRLHRAAARVRGGDRAVGRDVRHAARARSGPATTCSPRCAARRCAGSGSTATASRRTTRCSRASTAACAPSSRVPTARSTC